MRHMDHIDICRLGTSASTADPLTSLMAALNQWKRLEVTLMQLLYSSLFFSLISQSDIFLPIKPLFSWQFVR